jgi:nucleotide-binding universal stress UspA family protein/CheY-like chemotaxis protein
MIKKILVPVDGSENADKALELAVSMAKPNNAQLHLLHVVKHTEINKALLDYIRSEGINDTPYVVSEGYVENQIIGPAKFEAKRKGIEKIESTVLHGDPAEEIIDYAKDQEVDMIVMGSRGLGNVKGLMMGSVSTRVSHGADRTCVIVRTNPLDGKKILIVDDEPDVLETLEELLPMCDVTKAASFDRGKELLENQQFDMAILDIMGVQGYELLDIARDKKVIPVMLTAHALSPEHIVKSHKKGAAFYIPKDKMANMAIYLKDVLESRERGVNSWRRWIKRLGSYFDGVFGDDWRDRDKRFWDGFPYSNYEVF